MARKRKTVDAGSKTSSIATTDQNAEALLGVDPEEDLHLTVGVRGPHSVKMASCKLLLFVIGETIGGDSISFFLGANLQKNCGGNRSHVFFSLAASASF